ncbi:CPBP family intramembrane glutamic endopeptidase [Paenibacillus sp. GCM10023248]|uniref:CPBP family intramembrane glutamic endopeptidase n=1 Tax=Bacillales TaxID=1385 RepID=UPI002378AC2D|nr:MULTISPECIES: CPBP family intramembrane glutamic endopeptidase [Bacillales]MDD9271526.1 CPBP family intramembrane metalloprotease [Paenibacillus sp. MAHUQ-63]MDR6884293.1 membrane protease YdiL (CAAX protease family) [Bacillus sp. 3255]
MINFEERKRLISLIIVLCFAFLWPIINSTYLLFHPSSGAVGGSHLDFGFSVVLELLALILLGASLRSQQRSFKELGITFKVSDLGHAILLYFSFYILEILMFLFVPHMNAEVRNIGFLKSDMTPFYLIFILVNPFFEELIVRAYGITEFLHFFKKEEIAVLASTLIQTSYHLYQGAIPAILNGVLFFVFSIYFAKKRRIIPIILVHGFLDMYAMIQFHGT